jgi:dihydroflavonol-4-reductase
MPIIAVTGAAGHVGANLVRGLIAQGHTVRALVHRDQRALKGLDVELVHADIAEVSTLLSALDGVDIVYHAAAYVSISMGDWPQLQAVNVFGTRNIVEASLQCGVQRLVHFNSVEALLGRPDGKPIDESRPLVDSSGTAPYARSKAAGEREVRLGQARGLDAVILYPSAIIGPYDYRLGFPNAGLLAVATGRLWALVDGGFDWVDVRDIVWGALRAGEFAPAGSRYVLSGTWASLHDLADLAAEIKGTRVPRLVFPLWLARIGAPFAAALGRLSNRRPLYTRAALKPLSGNYHMSHARATRELGYRPRPLRDTVFETLQWFESNSP